MPHYKLGPKEAARYSGFTLSSFLDCAPHGWHVRFGPKSGHRRAFPYISATRRPDLFEGPLGTTSDPLNSPCMGNPKTNEWNLLKDQFDALAHNEGAREDSMEK